MDECWFEVEVHTDHGWGLVCLPPLLVHGGLVPSEVAKRYPTVDDAREHARRYGPFTRIFRCTEASREQVK